MQDRETSSADIDVDLPSVFVLLADSLRPEHDVIDTMDVLVEASAQFTSAIEAGIVLADADGGLHVVASTSERAADVEETQLGVDEGPCLDTARTGTPLEIPDLAAVQEKWPRFVTVAADRGFVASHTFPLSLRGETIGALNLFSDRLGPLVDPEAALVQAFAQVATIAVLQQRSLQRQSALSDQLQLALESRVLIEQAKGVLAHQHRIPVDHAFRMMRAHARKNNTRLHDVAEQIVHLQLTL